MLRRHGSLVAAGLALGLAVVALVLVLALRGGGGGHRAATRGEPLAYVPAGSADVVFDVDTREPLLGLAVEELAPRITKGAVTTEQVHARLGGRAVVAIEGSKAWLAFDARAGADAPHTSNGAAAAKRDGVIVIAPTRADLVAALQAARQPAARYARATFDRRFTTLPTKASARVAFDPRALIKQRAPQIANTRWANSLRDGAAVLTTSGTELHLPFRITADPVGLTADDLPIATGAQPPQARGNAPLTIGVRDPAHTVAFARNAGLLPALDAVDQIPGFLRPDLDDLGPNGTITSPTLSLSRVTLRSEPPDPGDWSTKLSRLDTLSGIAKDIGLADIGIDRRDGVYTITQNGKLVVRAGVFGRALTLSNDPTANLQAAAAAPAAPTPQGAAGALTARLRTSAVATQIPALVRARLGDLTGWARAELTGVTGELRLALR